MKSERIGYIDLARGLCMLFIMWGHVMLGGRTNTLVYAFHIPAFFFLSGLVYDGEKYKKASALAKRRWRTLLLPYLAWSAASWLWYVADILIRGGSVRGAWRYLLETLIARGSGGYMVHNVALWFVTCLFLTELLWYFISKPGFPIDLLCAAACAAAGVRIIKPYGVVDLRALPWSAEVALQAVVFYGLGNRARRLKNPPAGVCAAICLASAPLLYAGAMKNGHVTMAQGRLGQSPPLFYLTALCGVAFVWSLCLLLDRLPENPACSFLKWFGKNSFTVMAFHVPFMLLCVRLISRLWGVSETAARYSWKCTLPAMALMVSGSCLVVLIKEKIKKTRS